MNISPDININSLPGPDDTLRVQLKNGVTVLARSNMESPSVVVSGYFLAGSQFDPAGSEGLAYFTSSALMRGTKQRPFQKIFETLESAGASLGFGASVHTTSFGARALAEDLPLLLELLAECLSQPTFPGEYVERLRAQLLTGLAIRAQDTGDMASLTFEKLLFPNHPYGRSEEGYTDTVSSIQRSNILDFHHTHYGPRDMVIVVVGGVPCEKAVALVEQSLGGFENNLQPGMPDLPTLIPPVQTIREHVPIPGKSQMDLVMGCFGPHRKAEDYLAASLGNNILGQFGMMGRIGDVVREKAGLAYYASTSLNSWIAGGSWEVSAGVNPANLERAIDLIRQELDRFIQEGITGDELEDSQANFIGRLPLSLESNSGVANALLNLERFDLGLDYYRRYPKMVSEVTPEQVLEAARRYIDPQKLVIVSAGTLNGK